VYERILQRIRDKIRNREYVVTIHARREMLDDGYTIYDVERGILTGKVIERQRDHVTAEWKYRINGTTVSGTAIEILAKLSPTNKLVIITIYEP
jgi:hypothetical protein